MKKVILLVAVVAVMFALTAFVGVVKHSSDTNLVKVDNVATMTYGLEGSGYGMFKFHDHKAMNLRSIDKKAMKLRMSTKLPNK